MAARPRTICRHAGCHVLIDISGYCDKHESMRRKVSDERRGSSAERGYGSRWQKARATYLRSHPLCCKHEEKGEIVAATEVDHKVPHRGDQQLFWDRNNWQPLCKSCHSHKTATEDGGFGLPGGGQIFGRSPV